MEVAFQEAIYMPPSCAGRGTVPGAACPLRAVPGQSHRCRPSGSKSLVRYDAPGSRGPDSAHRRLLMAGSWGRLTSICCERGDVREPQSQAAARGRRLASVHTAKERPASQSHLPERA